MRRNLYIGAAVLVVAASGFAAGWFGHVEAAPGPLSLRQSDIASSTRYQFIDPLLAIRNPDGGNSPSYDALFTSVTGLIAEAQKNQILRAASVYFRELGPSQGFVISANEQYSPASLLKVPTMMTYLKLAESNPGALSSLATYSGTTDANAQEHIKSPVHLAPGTYSVQTLLEHMIKNSDNNAAETLINHLNDTGESGAFDTLFNDLGVSNVDLTNDFITVRGYALFFRVLYNATYLNRTSSEKALALLAQTDFDQGLRAGLPQDVAVSHKFGEFSQQDQGGTLLKRELHDCGIVYYPSHTYLLCVMTKGDDFLALEGFIKSVSSASYQFMLGKYSH